jgi:regulator of protease activity HflC (stomatin/prohibitin superfamily)
VNKIHKQIGPDFEKAKIMPIFEAALRNVIPKYKVLELNRDYRDQADSELAAYLRRELPSVYCDFIRVNITSLNIPDEIASVIISKQRQDELNLLAEKMKLENENKGKAKLVKDSLEYEAAKYQAMTMKSLSTPQNLALKELEIREIEARGYEKHGNSKFGSHNWFGANSSSVIKGLK